MSNKRFFLTLSGSFGFVILLIIGATIGGNILLQKQSAKLTQLKIENKVLETRQTDLVQAKRNLERYSELDKITKTIVPQDKDQARTVREIIAIAETTGVPIKSIVFDTSTLGTKAPASVSTPDTNSTPTTKAAPSQLKAVTGIPGVYSLELKVTSADAISYDTLINFLNKLESNRRTSHVTSIGLNPEATGNDINFTLSINAYVKP
jgi:hypothetical protein